MRIGVNDVKTSVSKLEKYIGSKIHRIEFFTSNFFALVTSFTREEEIIINLNNYNPFIYLDNIEGKGNVSLNKFLTRFKTILSNGYIKNISLYNNDKVIVFEITRKNQYYETENRKVYFELISYHPNIVICDENDTIIDAYKLIEITNKRPILIGMKYVPADKPENSVQSENDYDELVKELKNNTSNISLDSVKEKRKEVYKFLNNKRKSHDKKIDKLNLELEKAKNYGYYKELADALLVDKDNINNYEYEFNGEIYKLDKSKSINENINLLYKKYKKNKTAVNYILEQINITSDESKYYTSLLNTLYDLDDEEYEEVLKEFNLNKSKKPTKKNNVVRLNQIVIDDVRYIFGKNAIQNDFLTFKLAKKNEHWFHLEHYHGHHLIIRSDKKITNKEIETAAKIVVMLSNKLDGSVIHSLKENLFKGKEKGQVNLSKYETINVRVDSFDLIKNIEKLYVKA